MMHNRSTHTIDLRDLASAPAPQPKRPNVEGALTSLGNAFAAHNARMAAIAGSAGK